MKTTNPANSGQPCCSNTNKRGGNGQILSSRYVPRDASTVVFHCLAILAAVWSGVPLAHGKPEVPAQMSVELAEPTRPSAANVFVVTVMSQVPFDSGSVTLSIPPIGVAPANVIVLWTGSSDAERTNQLKHTLAALSPGKYQFRVSFMFTPARQGARPTGISKNLFVEVSGDAVLSSTVSFSQIRRVELKRELEKRGLDKHSIADVKAKAPDLAKQIEELNREELAPEQNRTKNQPPDASDTSGGVEQVAPKSTVGQKGGQLPPNERKAHDKAAPAQSAAPLLRGADAKPAVRQSGSLSANEQKPIDKTSDVRKAATQAAEAMPRAEQGGQLPPGEQKAFDKTVPPRPAN